MDQGAGTDQVMREAAGFLVPDLFRKGSVMAEDDVRQLAGQGALDQDVGQLLVIGDDIVFPAVDDIHKGHGILIVVSEHGDQVLAVITESVSHLRKGNDQDAGDPLQDREGCFCL